jgi:hypothetical protein
MAGSSLDITLDYLFVIGGDSPNRLLLCAARTSEISLVTDCIVFFFFTSQARTKTPSVITSDELFAWTTFQVDIRNATSVLELFYDLYINTKV